MGSYLGGMPFLVIFLVEENLHLGIKSSGFTLLILSLSACVAKFFINRFIVRIGIVQANYFFGTLCIISVIAYMIPVYTHNYLLLCLVTISYGIIYSCQATSMNSIMLIDMPQNLISSASVVQSITQQYFVSIGISLFGILIGALHNEPQQLMPEQISLLLLLFMILSMSCGLSGLYLIDRYYK